MARSALALVGARYRLHGREAASGLDCIGVIAAALRGAGWVGTVPSGYPLRGGVADEIVARFDAVLSRCDGRAAGDVLLFAVGPGQWHGAVRTWAGLVHADAGLRRVVERPGAAAWPLLAAWRYDDGGKG